jgi:hypothetical protein
MDDASGKSQHTVKKVIDFPVPSRDVTINYSGPGRVWLVTSRLGTGKSLIFFYSACISGCSFEICIIHSYYTYFHKEIRQCKKKLPKCQIYSGRCFLAVVRFGSSQRGGRGCVRRRIIRPQERLVLLKLLNTLCPCILQYIENDQQ